MERRVRVRPPRRIHKPEAGKEKPLVVIIDDDSVIRDTLNLVLRDKYRVKLCENGEDGVRTVDQTTETVVLDVKMPGMDGFEVYQKIKENYPDVPIIFFSGFEGLSEKMQLRKKYKPYAYFEKSGSTMELVQVIHKAVQHYEQVSKMNQVRSRLKEISEKEKEI